MTRYSKSLAELLAEEAPPPGGLPLPRLLHYADQSLGALHELHNLGVVMADLKPQNLLIDAGLDELVVTDFGISKILSDTVGSFTGTTMVQGTPHFMAPEQHVTDAGGNAIPLTPAADIWSWACTVIHMAQGQPPFAGLNISQILNTVAHQTRGPAVPGSLPAQLQQLLSRCLAADASTRPTATQALQALREAPSEGPASTGPLSLREALRSLRSPDLAAQATALQQLLVLTAGDTESAAQAREAVMGGLGAVVSIISSNSSSQGMQTDAAALLCCLARTDSDSTKIVAAPGCLTGLVGLLSSPSVSVQEVAAGALGDLAYELDNSQTIANVPGCLPALVALLSSPSVGVQAAAVGALWSLASGQDNSLRQAIVNVPACLPALVDLLSSRNVDVQKAAANALRKLAHEQDNISQAIANVPGCLPELVDLLRSRSVDVQVAAAAALHNLASGQDNISRAIANVPGCLRALAALLSSNCFAVRDAASWLVDTLGGV